MRSIILFIVTFSFLSLYAQNASHEPLLFTSDENYIYGYATACDADSLTAVYKAKLIARQRIISQIATQVNNVTDIYIHTYTQDGECKELINVTSNITNLSNRILVQSTCVYYEALKKQNEDFEINLIEQVPVNNILETLDSSINSALFNLDKYKEIYINNLKY